MELSLGNDRGQATEGILVLRLNEIVRTTVRKRLRELEDTIVSFSIEAIREALHESSSSNARLENPTGHTIPEPEPEPEPKHEEHETETVAMPTVIDNKEYYVLMYKDYHVVYDKITVSDDEAEIGESIVGVMDIHKHVWYPVRDATNDSITGYVVNTPESRRVISAKPVLLDNTTQMMPDW